LTDTRSQVASGLIELAKGDTDGEKAIRSLAAKLEAKDYTDLVGVDLATAYAPERMLPEPWKWVRHTLSGLELLRDALVFVPVAYTWWKIAEALEAFSSYRGSDPFLLAWQRGFVAEGSASVPQVEPLARSAITVASVLAMVVALTVVTHLGRGLYERRLVSKQRRLAALLAEATQIVIGATAPGDAAGTRAELATIAAKVSKASSDLSEKLGNASDAIVSAVKTGPGSDLQRMFEKWVAAADKLERLGERLQSSQQELDRLSALQEELATLCTEFSAESKNLLIELRRERQVSRDEAQAHLAMADEVAKATQTLNDSLLALNERAEQFKDIVNRLEYIVEQLDDDRYAR